MRKSSDTHTQAHLTSGQMDDATLCQRIVENRDTDAFAAYMERHRAKFVRFLQRKFYLQTDEAEDCFQDAFIKLYRAMQNPDRRFCENPAHLKTWLHTCMIHDCQNSLKKHKRLNVTNSFDSVRDQVSIPGDYGPDNGFYPDLPDASLPWGGHSQDPLICLEFTRTARKIETEWAAYKDEHRCDDSFICLALQERGLSYEEIAAITQTAVGTVRSRISRAKNKISDHFNIKDSDTPTARLLRIIANFDSIRPEIASKDPDLFPWRSWRKSATGTPRDAAPC